MPYVNSTAIHRVEWNAGVLWIWFTSDTGKGYEYPGVPESLYRQFLAAPSKGQFYDLYIRDTYVYR